MDNGFGSDRVWQTNVSKCMKIYSLIVTCHLSIIHDIREWEKEKVKLEKSESSLVILQV